MSQIYLHQSHHTLADFSSISQYLKQSFSDEGLHLFPELFLTGYPLQDLCLQRPFIKAYQKHLSDIETWAKSLSASWSSRALMGGLAYEMDEAGLPLKITNVMYEVIPGKGLKILYTKRLLPNYDIFDEEKYFTAGHENAYYQFESKTYGLLICEDMWHSSIHLTDPCREMKTDCDSKKLKLDGVINLSASPFDVDKIERRLKRGKELSHLFEAPFIYVNRVGGEDEVLFDGSSFIVLADEILLQGKPFVPEILKWNHQDSKAKFKSPTLAYENTWEGLFTPRLDYSQKPIELKPWSDQQCELILKALCFGLQEYASKSGFNHFLVALSGGIDSALVLALVKLALKPGQSVEAIYMPSVHSSSISTQLAEEMCRRIGIKMQFLPIKFFHSSVKNAFTQTFEEPFTGLTDENIQSRLRGTLLYTRSNQTGAMVINTSNKSELAVGYSTQYGDSVGAISMLGDLFKTEVYRLSEYLNKHHGNLIPDGIIERGPSAELRDNQLDQDSLPPYKRLDAMLEGILSYRLDAEDLAHQGFSEEEIRKVFSLYTKSEYKRKQFCPIIKTKTKSFGFGHRVPISKSLKFYQQ